MGAAVSEQRAEPEAIRGPTRPPAGQLHYWTYSPHGLKADIGATGFHEVTAAVPWKSATSWAAEIVLPDGATVRLDGRAELAWVKQALESLRLSS